MGSSEIVLVVALQVALLAAASTVTGALCVQSA
jgi:hypothetical protein